MKPLTINLASRPFRNNTVLAAVLGGATGVIALATALNLCVFFTYGHSYERVQHEEARERTRLQTLASDEGRLTREIETRDFQRAYNRGRLAQDIILKRAFSWTLLFNKLETVVPPEVMMRAIRPNITGEGISVRVDGVAKTSGGLYTFLDRLLEDPSFARAYPLSERRMNPTRPEIDFAVNFDYLPNRAAAPPAVVAQADTAQAATAASAAPPAAAGGAEETPAATDAAPQPRPAAAGPVAATASSPKGIVGRDGRPRTPELLAMRVAAPGGVYPPPPPREGAGSDTPSPSSKSAAGLDEARPRRAGKDTAARPARPVAVPKDADGKGAAARPEQSTGAGAIHTSVNLPPQLLPRPGYAAGAPPAPAAAEPAMRLDVPLSFVQRPVGEIYDALAKAHDVHFEFEPGVDRKAKVTANLRGKGLEQAIEVVSRLAGQRVERRGNDMYHVYSQAVRPLRESPIQEEDLAPGGGRP
jgi:Tfp pilus assembly protein PilN